MEHLGFCLWFSISLDAHVILYTYSVLWSGTNLISVFFQERLIEGGSDIQEVGRKVSEEIRHYKQRIEEDIEQITKCMKHCKFEQFKVLMTLLDMGVEIKGASISTIGKISPFRNIYFYDKKNLEEAREMEWKDIPVLPVPE